MAGREENTSDIAATPCRYGGFTVCYMVIGTDVQVVVPLHFDAPVQFVVQLHN